ncbi:DNA methylase [Vibrio phage 11895-B1]|uniref:DNA methylase n=1 Tax=Vibrio phage 11895-B1 TaxID=754075 RepID=UPI0002C084E7|nr:DNA methylase [Vibrio phage 11895-B1]AGH32119.1 DNA methylase [Vibrio phage 11895-B1]
MNSDFLQLDSKDIPDISLVLTDPPYGTTKAKWDSLIDLPSMWSWLDRVTSENIPILLFCQLPFDKVLGASNIKSLKYEWIWEKTSATGHLNAKKMPMKAHENILVFYDKLPSYYPQKTSGHVKKEATKRKEVSDKCELYGANTKDVSYSSTDRYPRDVLKFPSDKQKINLNSTQKPLDLLRYLIRTYTNEGDTILDFTAGSMSTAVAAYLEGRNSFCIEMDKDQYIKSVEWVKCCRQDNHYKID